MTERKQRTLRRIQAARKLVRMIADDMQMEPTTASDGSWDIGPAWWSEGMLLAITKVEHSLWSVSIESALSDLDCEED